MRQSVTVIPVEKRGRDARMEGKRAYIGGGTVSRSVYRKEKMGAPKKPPTYLHIQIESGVHRVGQTPENVNNPEVNIFYLGLWIAVKVR